MAIRSGRVGVSPKVVDTYGNLKDNALPVASASTVGGVKVGDNLSIASDGTLSSVVPVATNSTLGGVKVGDYLDITQQGVLSGVNQVRRTRNNITDNLTNLSTAIAEQNLEKYGYAIGDYYVGASGYYYYLADMDTFYGGYNSYAVVNTHHCGIVVDTMSTSAWLTEGEATSYSTSTLHTFLSTTALDNIKTDLTTLFGGWENHLVSHRIMANGVGNWDWVSDVYISALTEVQMYGCPIWSGDKYQQGEGVKKLTLFDKFRFNEIYGNTWIWLRSLYSASHACYATNSGNADNASLPVSFRASGLILFK